MTARNAPMMKLIQAQAEADAAARAVMTDWPASHKPTLRYWLDYLGTAIRMAADDASAIAAAQRAADVCRALAALPAGRKHALAEPEEMLRRCIPAATVTERTAAAIAAVWASSPVLADFRAELDERDATRARWIEQARREEIDRDIADAPGRVLALLDSKGIHLTVKNGHIVAPPGTVPAELKAMVAQHKPALVKLLTERADAAKPEIIA